MVVHIVRWRGVEDAVPTIPLRWSRRRDDSCSGVQWAAGRCVLRGQLNDGTLNDGFGAANRVRWWEPMAIFVLIRQTAPPTVAYDADHDDHNNQEKDNAAEHDSGRAPRVELRLCCGS